MRHKILITGYEPFGGSDMNPSGRAAQALGGELIHGHRVVGRVLPVAYQEVITVMVAIIEEIQPQVVIMSGQSGRPDIALEKVAVNVSGPGQDNVGHDPHDEPVVAGGPASYFSTLPITAILQALRQAKIPASVSYTAGTYLCNHIFYGTMHYLRDRNIPAGFFHVPSLPEQKLEQSAASMSQDMITEALRVAARTALAAPGLPLHLFRERAEIVWQKQQTACLREHQLAQDGASLGYVGELDWLLKAGSGPEAPRWHMLGDAARRQRERAKRQEALKAWEQGDYEEALNLTPHPLFAFAQWGGAELLPFAERMLARLGLSDTGGDRDEVWDDVLTPERLWELMQATLRGLELGDAPIHRWQDGAAPLAAFTDRAWLKLAPGVGQGAYARNLSALGQALHLALMSRGLPWEYRRLGDGATLRASGLLFAGLVHDASWLRHHAGVPADDGRLRQLSRHRQKTWRQSALLVRACQKAHAVGKRVEAGEQSSDTVVEYIIEATGGALSRRQAVKVILDGEESLLDFRAMLFECGLRADLVRNHGPRWWQEPGAGTDLHSLWRQGLRSECWWERVQGWDAD